MRNWKNSMEDIWFVTKSKDYTFNPDAVKIRRRVIAPYRVAGKPKDWEETAEGNFRNTGACSPDSEARKAARKADSRLIKRGRYRIRPVPRLRLNLGDSQKARTALLGHRAKSAVLRVG